jgi:subtilase family protein
MRHRAALSLLVLGVGLLALGAPAWGAGTVSPLPASDYGVSAACAAPGPGEASCQALQLIPQTAEARAHTHPLGITRAATTQTPSPAAGNFGLRPQDLHSAYQLPTSAVTSQTIAIVDAYNDLTAEADLGTYDREFSSLPACTGANGCFKQLNQNGSSESASLPFPKSKAELEAARAGSPGRKREAERAEGWALEISLDIEVAHATCQSCQIVLVEANSAIDENLRAAEQTAVAQQASEISNSWAGPERAASEGAGTFDHRGVVITASAGDYGYLNWNAPEEAERGHPEFPASSPDVVAVGGTRLALGAGGSWQGETVWNGHGAGGSSCSVEFSAQPWQRTMPDWGSLGCAEHRAVADISADADPYTGVAVYDSNGECEYEEAGRVHFGPWCTLGGTSLSSPLIAAAFALAGGSQGVPYPAKTLYENELKTPGSLHDVLEGSNGLCAQPFNEETGLSSCSPANEAEQCESKLACKAAVGYDGPTGVGTPNGLGAFEPPAGGNETDTEKPSSGASTSSPPQSSTPTATAPGAGAGASTVPGPSAPASVTTTTVQLSSLALTLHAIVALNHSRPRASQVAFNFTVNAASHLRVTLSKRSRVHGRLLWQALRDSLTIAAAGGRNSHRLSAHNVLATGLYRLTLTPSHGAARSVVFQIG